MNPQRPASSGGIVPVRRYYNNNNNNNSSTNNNNNSFLPQRPSSSKVGSGSGSGSSITRLLNHDPDHAMADYANNNYIVSANNINNSDEKSSSNDNVSAVAVPTPPTATATSSSSSASASASGVVSAVPKRRPLSSQQLSLRHQQMLVSGANANKQQQNESITNNSSNNTSDSFNFDDDNNSDNGNNNNNVVEQKQLLVRKPLSSNEKSRNNNNINNNYSISTPSTDARVPPTRVMLPNSASYGLPTQKDHLRRFNAVETSARGKVLADETEQRDVMVQWFFAQRYQDRERHFVKMRMPEKSYFSFENKATFETESEARQRREVEVEEEKLQEEKERMLQEQKLQEEILAEANYKTFTERSGRMWGTRNKKVPQQKKLLADKNDDNNTEITATASSVASEFEKKLLAASSKHGGAFEIEPEESSSSQQQQQNDKNDINNSEFYNSLTPKSCQRQKLEHSEQIERTIFVASIFLPEVLRCVEDAESIERNIVDEGRTKDLDENCKTKYLQELKPLMHDWRKREHAALTVQCAFRKIQRNSFGWKRTHKQIGYEIETMRREKQKKFNEQQEQQEKQQQDTSENNNNENNKTTSTTANPRTSRYAKTSNSNNNKQALAAIAELEAEGERLKEEKRQQEVKDFLSKVQKQREDVEFEAKWCLQRELQYMSSTFYDNVTKPAADRVSREESQQRQEISQNQCFDQLDKLFSEFSLRRQQIQDKNKMEKEETAQRRLIESSHITNLSDKMYSEMMLDRTETIQRILSRFKRERQQCENDSLKERNVLETQSLDGASEIFMWHCSVVDDSLFLFEKGEREFLIRQFLAKHYEQISSELFNLHSETLGTNQFLRQHSMSVILEGVIQNQVVVFEPIQRQNNLQQQEENSFLSLKQEIQPRLDEIKKASEKRVAASSTIQNFWRSYKQGEVGRSGRLKYYDRCFAQKKRAAAKRKARQLVEQTQSDLENALREANIFIVAGFSQKLQLLQKQEKREREDIETDDGLMRRIFDANMVSAIADTCVNETTVLSRFEAYHRFQFVQEERTQFSKYVTFMELVFVKDVKIRPAQRAIRCHLARKRHRELISEALLNCQTSEQEKRTKSIMMEQLSCVADLFLGNILHALYNVSFASATTVWVTEQERAARECIVDERDQAARGYLGWLASLGKDSISEQQSKMFREEVVEGWRKEMFALDLFALEISERNTVISLQSEVATRSLLSHVETIHRVCNDAIIEQQSLQLAISALELHESTQRVIIDREAISIGFSVLLFKQEGSQRSILSKHLLSLADLNMNIYQLENEARVEIDREWYCGRLHCLATYEQEDRFTVMQQEFNLREEFKLLSFENDWRIDCEAARRYEVLMLVELAESSKRKTFLIPEMKALENIVEFNHDCIKKKDLLFESDFCHGLRAILESQQHEQRKFIMQDEQDDSRYLFEQVQLAQRLSLDQAQSQKRAEILHLEETKWDFIYRYHVKLIRNENYRAADVVWRQCATRAIKEKDAVDYFAITSEVFNVLTKNLMTFWMRQHATEVCLFEKQSLGQGALNQLTRDVDSVLTTMGDALQNDSYYQAMLLLMKRQKIENELWSEQSGIAATQILSSDEYLLPNLHSEISLESRKFFDLFYEERERGALTWLESKTFLVELQQEEYLQRNVLILVESEMKERFDEILSQEREEHNCIMMSYQDEILKPLEALRDEGNLRDGIVLEEVSEFSRFAQQCQDEYRFVVGPQRAWSLMHRQAEILKTFQKVNERGFLEMQEQRAHAATDFKAITNNEDRQLKAVSMMLRWSKRRLWTTKANFHDKQTAEALAISDCLSQEEHSGIDIRDRFEKISFCVVLIQKIFRGHRSRVTFDRRMEMSRELKKVHQDEHLVKAAPSSSTTNNNNINNNNTNTPPLVQITTTQPPKEKEKEKEKEQQQQTPTTRRESLSPGKPLDDETSLGDSFLDDEEEL